MPPRKTPASSASAPKTDIQTCQACNKRYHAGANESKYVGYCGECDPRVPADFYSDPELMAASRARIAGLVAEGRLSEGRSGAVPASRPEMGGDTDDAPDWDELQ